MEEIVIETLRGRFAAREGGLVDAPVVILLHGFPDDASTFDELSEALIGAGFRAVAPYLRGYDPSPLDGALDLTSLAEDLVAVADAVSPNQSIRFVGHDYGAQVGYAAMARSPQRFEAAVALAGAHPAIIARNMRTLPRQWWMSRYIAFFQLGRLADWWMAQSDFAAIDRLWQRWSPGFRPPATHMDHVKATLRRSMPAPFAMYRAGGFDLPADPVPVPLLFIAGLEDGCLLPALAAGQSGLFPDGYEEIFLPNVGHFPHLEQPAEVARVVVRFLSKSGQQKL